MRRYNDCDEITNTIRIYEQGEDMHQPTERVIRILETAAARGGGRLTDFSAELGIPKSTLLPILTTLTARHYLMREGERYYPGSSVPIAVSILRGLGESTLSRYLTEPPSSTPK